MPRFVLRYRGKGAHPVGTAEQLRAAGASLIEDSGRMLLVDAAEADLRTVLSADEWLIVPEVSYGQPNPRLSIK